MLNGVGFRLTVRFGRANFRGMKSVLPDWRELPRLPDDELESLDVAVMNLSCAVGLPGSEVIDEARCLRTLDKWADTVRNITAANFQSGYRAKADLYDYSPNLFRAVMLVKILQKHCGVRYNPVKIGAKGDDPFDLEDVFIHGVIQGPGGTRANLPIVFAAVGRRLGYPLKIVKALEHVFNRWDDPLTGERFNLCGATVAGNVLSHSDDYYRNWPHALPVEFEKRHGYLESLTPRRELALGIGTRANQWTETGNYREAFEACAAAIGLEGENETYPCWSAKTADKWFEKLRRRFPPGFPSVEIGLNENQRRWPKIPWRIEVWARHLEAVEDVLNDSDCETRWWKPLRERREPLTKVPVRIRIDRSGVA